MAFIAVVSRVVARVATLVSAAVVVEFANAMETFALLAVAEIAVAVVVTEVAAFAIVFAATFAVVAAFFTRIAAVVSAVTELGCAAFLAGGVFPAALVAGFLRHDGDGALLTFLLLALAVFGVFFALLAREEFLAFGFRAAA